MNPRVLGWVKEGLYWENWAKYVPELIYFAQETIRARRWRGDFDGVLPGGYDAESIVSEVIFTALQGKSRVVPGWTKQRLMRELKRLIRNKVRTLQCLKESEVVRNEWDVVPADDEADGEEESIFESIAGQPWNDVEEVLARERAGRRVVAQIASALHHKDKKAGRVFRCIRKGIVEPRIIAARARMSPAEVANCKKRLRRRVEELMPGLQGAEAPDRTKGRGTKRSEGEAE